MPNDVIKYFNPDWYLRRYPDIKKAGIDPLVHFRKFGLVEGRDANPVLDHTWYTSKYMSTEERLENPLIHYARVGRKKGYLPNAFVDLDFVREEYKLSIEDDVLEFLALHHGSVDKINAWFSRDAYLDLNHDLANSPSAPEIHFWDHGILEGRRFGEGLSLKPYDEYVQSSPFERIVAEVPLSDRMLVVVSHRATDNILRQIKEQAKIDPDIVAAGVPCLPYMRKFDSTDLKARDGIDSRRVLDEISSSPDAIILMPQLRLGGSDKYAAQLAWGLSQAGVKSVLIVTTDGLEAEDRAALELEGLAGYREFKIVSLRDWAVSNHDQEMFLALLLLAAKPSFLFVMNSDLGFRTVKSYGKQLSSTTKVFCAFFSESPNAIGAPWSARYVRDVAPHAFILSDNKPALKVWGNRLGGHAEDRLVLLPPMVRRSSLGARSPFRSKKRRRARGSFRRALWISRWEPFKALDVLREIAKQEPFMIIHAFGPVFSADDAKDLPPNIKLMGVLKDLSKLPIEQYDFMLFTSYFEGMPNIVLEMAEMGIPIVASDVGGLRDTFPENTIKLVAMEGTREEMANRFRAAANEICTESHAARLSRIERTKEAVLETHGSENFLRLLKKMIKTDHV